MRTSAENQEQALVDPWDLLQQELDRWQSSGHTATFWWRDDDACVAGPKLERLLRLTNETGILLAIIPSRIDQTLAPMIEEFKNVYVAQHGYAHINYAPRGVGAGAWELGLHRPLEVVMEELHHGKAILEQAISGRFLSVIVPPWNHIDKRLLAPIADAGYRGISAFGTQPLDNDSLPVNYANTHCDPVRWKTGAKFRGEAKSIMQLIEHLQARRTGHAHRNESTGYLTHHIDLDEDSWEFSEKLHGVVSQHPAAAWVSPIEVFKEI